MRRAADAPELLDGHLDDPETLRDNLRDMGRANRFTGGTVLSIRAIEALAPRKQPLSVLDVGTGGADIPLALLADRKLRERPVTVTAVDSRPEVLDAARAARPGLDEVDGLRLEVADGHALPYPGDAFGVAHASLVLHHLEPADAVRFLRELARVAQEGVVVNDLARHRFTILGAWLLARACSRNRYTHHDAPLSARRSYTLDEAVGLLVAAGLRPVYSAELLGHRWAIAAVRR